MVLAIKHRVKAIEPAPPQGPATLSVVPILGKSHRVPTYALMTEKQTQVQISEVSESGSVPTLRVKNGLDKSLYLIDGQELVGAKQNRILNTDVLVPAQTLLDVPVSCVEQGRWDYSSPTFKPGKSASHGVRAGKQMRIRESLMEDRGHDADQGEVWDNVSHAVESAGTDSPTEALHDAYASRDRELNDFRQKLSLPRKAVGIAVFEHNRLLGIDVFDRHSTLAYFWESLVDSYVIEYLHAPVDPGTGASAETQPLQNAINTTFESLAQGHWQSFESPGEGTDLRYEDDNFCGSALTWEDRVVVHLQVLPKQEGTGRRAERETALHPTQQVRRRYDIPRPRPIGDDRG